MKTRYLAFILASVVLLIGIALFVWAKYANPKMKRRELIIYPLLVVSISLLTFVTVCYYNEIGAGLLFICSICLASV